MKIEGFTTIQINKIHYPIITQIKLSLAEKIKLNRLDKRLKHLPSFPTIRAIMIIDFTKPTAAGRELLGQQAADARSNQPDFKFDHNDAMGITEYAGQTILYIGLGALRMQNFQEYFDRIFQRFSAHLN